MNSGVRRKERKWRSEEIKSVVERKKEFFLRWKRKGARKIWKNIRE